MLKQRGFIKNTVILFLGMVITKGLGAALKIPLANILGGEGMGYFTTAYRGHGDRDKSEAMWLKVRNTTTAL